MSVRLAILQLCGSFFFFNDTPTTEIYTLSLHDALPIFQLAPRPQHQRGAARHQRAVVLPARQRLDRRAGGAEGVAQRSEEHTSELQSRQYLVCRLLVEKKKILRTLRWRCGPRAR